MNEEWRNHAACRGVSAEQFFPEKDDGGVHPGVRALCASCVVRSACLDYALVHEAHGFWGGETARGRRKIRVRLRMGDYPEETGRGLRVVTHGRRATYDRGCRCEPCREVKAESKQRARRAERLAEMGGAA